MWWGGGVDQSTKAQHGRGPVIGTSKRQINVITEDGWENNLSMKFIYFIDLGRIKTNKKSNVALREIQRQKVVRWCEYRRALRPTFFIILSIRTKKTNKIELIVISNMRWPIDFYLAPLSVLFIVLEFIMEHYFL